MLGEQQRVHCISTANLSPGEIHTKVLEIVDRQESRSGGVLLAVDLKGGSTWHAACKIAHTQEHVAVISGINLPILLSFFTKRNDESLDQLVDKLVAVGKQGIEKYVTQKDTQS